MPTNPEKSLKERKLAEFRKQPGYDVNALLRTNVEKFISDMADEYEAKIEQAKREIAKDLDEIHASFPEDSPSQEWWEATDKLLNYIQKLKSHLTDKKDV